MLSTYKRIEGFENYGVSVNGEVVNFNNINTLKPFFLKHMITRKGYHMVALYDKGKRNWRTVARLVAEAYIPNPENKPQVNHMNSNKNINCDWNLEWSTGSENMLHSFRVGLRKPALNAGRKRIKVKVYEYKTNKYLSSHDSATAAAQFYGASRGNVGQILKGNRQQTKGFTFKSVII